MKNSELELQDLISACGGTVGSLPLRKLFCSGYKGVK